MALTFTCKRGEATSKERHHTDWDSVFATIGVVCMNRATEGRLLGHLSDWVYEETGSRLVQVEIAAESFQKVKLQLFSLGLIEIEREAATLFWRLTDSGRIALAHLAGEKRPFTAGQDNTA